MKNVQDIYPVSPMQEFMLLHGLSNAKSDTLFNQFVFSVTAALDPNAFEQAWSLVVSSHSALRTAFIWQGVDTPQQVVRQSVKLKCESLDYRQHGEELRETAFARVLHDDREVGFDFRRAPLMRFILVRFGQQDWRVVWSSHHLILDRWCIDGLIAEFQQHYRAALSGTPGAVTRAPSYRDYIAWIQQQDRKAAFAYWRGYLAGFSQPSTTDELVASDHLRDTERSSYAQCSLGRELTQRARLFSRNIGVTLGCVVQAALALAVNRVLKRADVVFGVTVAGRPAAVAHVEDIVGSFINTIPVRVKLASSISVGDLLRQLGGARFASAEYDYLSPAQLRTCAAVGSDRPLFDVLVVWLVQTKLEDSEVDENEALPLVAASEQYATAYPLTLSVIEKTDELVFRADASRGQTLPLKSLLEIVSDTLLQILDGSAEDSLQQFQGVTLLNEEEQLSSRPDVTAEIDIFELSRPGVAKVRGREDAQIDVVEELLRSEWKQVLGSDRSIEIDDDFFELGGDSLKAAALHARIELATRKAMPLLALFEHSTLQGMTRTLVDEEWPLRAGIAMPLRVNGSRPTLFCVASPEVNTIGYAMLTRHLSEKYNTVLLQAPPESEDLLQFHPDDLSSVASNYVKALKEIQPDGPYSLLSMCAGSHIALNMVRQLETDGSEIGFMGVINTWSLYSISWRFYLNRLFNVSNYYAQRLNRLILGRLRSVVPNETAVAAAGSTAVEPAAPKRLRVLPADAAVGLSNPWIRQVGLAHRMPAGQKANVTVSVFRLADQPFWRTGERALGWHRLAGKAHAINIPGSDHDSILREPQVTQVAQAIEEELERVASVIAGQLP